MTYAKQVKGGIKMHAGIVEMLTAIGRGEPDSVLDAIEIPTDLLCEWYQDMKLIYENLDAAPITNKERFAAGVLVLAETSRKNA